MDKDADWYVPPNLVPTWLTDAAGNLLLLSQSEWGRRDLAQ